MHTSLIAGYGPVKIYVGERKQLMTIPDTSTLASHKNMIRYDMT